MFYVFKNQTDKIAYGPFEELCDAQQFIEVYPHLVINVIHAVEIAHDVDPWQIRSIDYLNTDTPYAGNSKRSQLQYAKGNNDYVIASWGLTKPTKPKKHNFRVIDGKNKA